MDINEVQKYYLQVSSMNPALTNPRSLSSMDTIPENKSLQAAIWTEKQETFNLQQEKDTHLRASNPTNNNHKGPEKLSNIGYLVFTFNGVSN